jgi:hypothetical protein
MENRWENRLVVNIIVAVIAVAPPCMAAGTSGLTVVVYDRVGVTPETLAKAENTVSKIFGHASVQLVWRNRFTHAGERHPSQNLPPEAPATLVIKLQPESDTARYGVDSVCGGIALESGAIVFVRSVDPASMASGATRLGYVMAHELGHILLGPNAHSLWSHAGDVASGRLGKGCARYTRFYS